MGTKTVGTADNECASCNTQLIDDACPECDEERECDICGELFAGPQGSHCSDSDGG